MTPGYADMIADRQVVTLPYAPFHALQSRIAERVANPHENTAYVAIEVVDGMFSMIAYDNTVVAVYHSGIAAPANFDTQVIRQVDLKMHGRLGVKRPYKLRFTTGGCNAEILDGETVIDNVLIEHLSSRKRFPAYYDFDRVLTVKPSCRDTCIVDFNRLARCAAVFSTASRGRDSIGSVRMSLGGDRMRMESLDGLWEAALMFRVPV